MRPKTLVSAAPMAKIETIWIRFEMRVGVLEGMGGIGVEEAAAIGAEHLDRICEATGPDAMVCCAPSSVVALT
jgi:hypothetical protein